MARGEGRGGEGNPPTRDNLTSYKEALNLCLWCKKLQKCFKIVKRMEDLSFLCIKDRFCYRFCITNNGAIANKLKLFFSRKDFIHHEEAGGVGRSLGL